MMWSYHGMQFGWSGPMFSPTLGLGFLLVMLWSVFWKGLGLWHSAQRGNPWWFVVILFINTAGILEIIYLFAILKLKAEELFSNHHHHHS